MVFRNLFQKFGGWTTLMKWHEPWMYRVRLKGDWLSRFALAFALGSLATTLLLVLFAVNIKPPHPLFAFTGMAIVGGLTFMFLVNGRGTAGGRVRLCEEGIIRKRMYVGFSAQWVEDWSWPYSQIPQCAIIPGVSIDKSFAVLLLTNGSDIELIGIPERVNLEQVDQLFAASGIVVRRDVGIPPQFLRPIGLPIPLVAGLLSLFVLFGGLGFYALKTVGRNGNHGNEAALGNRDASSVRDRDRRAEEDVSRFQPHQTEEVTRSAPLDTPPPAQPESSGFRIPNLPLRPPSGSSIPNDIPSPIVTDAPTPDSTPLPLASSEPDPATATPKPLTSATSVSANTRKTELLGGSGGGPFEVIPPNHDPIIGFRFRLGSWDGKSAVATLDPISQRDTRARPGSLVIAREGFVVGGIQVDAEDLVQAVRVVFVKRADNGTLDKTDYYFSEWIGEPTGRTVKTLGKGNVPVVGVYGRRGLVIDAIGLVLAE